MSAHQSSGHTVQGASNASSFGTATLSGSEEHPVHVVMQSQKGDVICPLKKVDRHHVNYFKIRDQLNTN